MLVLYIVCNKKKKNVIITAKMINKKEENCILLNTPFCNFVTDTKDTKTVYN